MNDPASNQSTGMSILRGDAWWKDAVIYELYVDKFAGTLDGLVGRLDYLSRLGVTCMHILPHYPSPMIDDGYDVSDYMNVREGLGTIADFERLANAAHDRGIRIMVDLVLNHVSTKHPWFVEASSSKRNPKREYFLWSETGTEFASTEVGFKDIKTSNWISNPLTNDFYYSTFYPEQADLDWDNPDVLAEMKEIMGFWAGLGADGFRLDASHLLVKREGTASKGLPETHDIIKSIRVFLDANHPGTVLLAEVHDQMPETMKYFGNGDECHLVYHFQLVEQILLAMVRGTTEGLEKIIEESLNIPPSCAWANFLRHHDEISLATLGQSAREEILERFDPERRFRFSTGTSMRLATLFNGSRQRTLSAYELLFSVPGAHIVYYGDEIGMRNGPLEPGEKDTRKCLRENFDWAEALVKSHDPSSLVSQVSELIMSRRASRATEKPALAPAP